VAITISGLVVHKQDRNCLSLGAEILLASNFWFEYALIIISACSTSATVTAMIEYDSDCHCDQEIETRKAAEAS
jgi:hypothetical protein